jgi:hypothetical protein
MRREARDRDHARLRFPCQIRQSRAGQFVKRARHDGERPFKVLPPQVGETATIGKARGMHDGVDAAERFACGADKLDCRSGNRQIAAAPDDLRAGTLTLGGNRFQSRQPRIVRALSMQHQALVRTCKPARHRSADPGPATGDD